jgi:vancomycin permeability regulator SanA
MIGTPSLLPPRSKSPSRLRRFVLLAAAIGLPLLGVAAIEAHMAATTRAAIHGQIAAVPRRRVAIVFGAQVLPSGRPSQALAHRLDAAVALYRAGLVERLLLTGDGGAPEYDEPAAMRAYVLARGVPDGAIVRDPAGFRTYDSCHRARVVFGIGPDEAVLVTQAYHLPRAVYTCARLGVRADGFVAAPFVGPRAAAAERREHPARWLAWWEVTVTRPTPRRLMGDG